MTKTFRDNCNTNIVQKTSCEPLFREVQKQLKMYILVPFVRHVCITNMVEFQKVTHAKIACGLYFWMQSSIQPALESEY